jgi:hypothetical protein
VVMIRVIVAEILVHVQRRPHGGRCDHGLNERECDQTAHVRLRKEYPSWARRRSASASVKRCTDVRCPAISDRLLDAATITERRALLESSRLCALPNGADRAMLLILRP